MKKIISFLLVTLVFLTGCGSNSSDLKPLTEPITIDVWHPFTAGIESALQDTVNGFNDSQDMVTVKLTAQGSYTDLQKKLVAAGKSNELPALAFSYSTWDDVLEYAQDISGYEKTKDYELDFSTFVDAYIQEITTEDGAILGIPFNKSTESLVFNKDLTDKAGITKAPTTLEELFADAKTITDKTGVVAIGFDSLQNYLAQSINSCGQNEWLTDDNTFDFASDCIVDSVNLYKDAIDGGYARVAGEDGYMSGPFGSGQVASYIGSTAGASYVDAGVDGKFEWSSVATPFKSVVQQGTNLVMFKDTTGEEKMAAWMFMNYVAQDDVTTKFAEATGYLPVTKSALKSDEYTKFMETNAVAKSANEVTDRLSIVQPQIAGANDIYSTYFKQAMESILTGGTDTKTALEQLNKDAQDIYDRLN